jgi:hypothetical protein
VEDFIIMLSSCGNEEIMTKQACDHANNVDDNIARIRTDLRNVKKKEQIGLD